MDEIRRNRSTSGLRRVCSDPHLMRRPTTSVRRVCNDQNTNTTSSLYEAGKVPRLLASRKVQKLLANH
jgi:hypothetical protein